IWSTHPLRLLELFAGPLYFAQPGTPEGVALAHEVLRSNVTSLWAGSLAVAPVATVLAALAAWHHRRASGTGLLAAAFGFALWLSLGRYAGATTLLSALPVLKSFRYPEKWMVWVALTTALGAAHGVRLRAALPLAALAGAAGLAVALTGQLP